jgi:hypothetical protein
MPSVLYPFTSPTRDASLKQLVLGSRGTVYRPRLNELEVVLKGQLEDEIKVPYNYIVGSGITMVFLGVALIALNSRKVKQERRVSNNVFGKTSIDQKEG